MRGMDLRVPCMHLEHVHEPVRTCRQRLESAMDVELGTIEVWTNREEGT